MAVGQLGGAGRGVGRRAGVGRREGPREARDLVQEAAGHTREAQQLLAQMDQAAGSRAASALQALDRPLPQLPSLALSLLPTSVSTRPY